MKNKIYTNDMSKTYPILLHELEKYVYYCLRCLHRGGIYPRPEDFILLNFVRKNNTVAEMVVYPENSITPFGEVVNPLFSYGFKADYDFSNLEVPIKITFSESYDELKK